MKKLKYIIIWILDKIDDKLIKHRCHYICDKIGLSNWWNRKEKMGASQFVVVGKGKSAVAAFNSRVEKALYEYGHSGYTGTIAEKDRFVIIPCPSDIDPETYAYQLLKDGDPRISDKWGPAGCIVINKENKEYLFFGWASN